MADGHILVDKAPLYTFIFLINELALSIFKQVCDILISKVNHNYGINYHASYLKRISMYGITINFIQLTRISSSTI